ncbi:hypothetical protein EVAR_50026_1 [Eumeta japonica]|uniref:Uncharacterized protein n=1 Tax=Eumeta variegata TaxID=151549 RepID=A0A4C1YTR0_EUMVA|nr:hypothetical protein EVAR_50026_1 [Eumeta japonica]
MTQTVGAFCASEASNDLCQRRERHRSAYAYHKLERRMPLAAIIKIAARSRGERQLAGAGDDSLAAAVACAEDPSATYDISFVAKKYHDAYVSLRNLNEDRILAVLSQSDAELPCEDTNNRVSGHESDVQSDIEDGFIDEAQEEHLPSSGNEVLEQQSTLE